MSLQACAEIVQRGDPDRFLATMAAPVAARRVLFPIYAANVEIARAPWASEEPIIAEMRLQWWWDALDEIATGRAVRSHEVTTPLAEVLPAEGAVVLQRTVDARRREAHRGGLADVGSLATYLDDTSGALMWAATRALDPSLASEARIAAAEARAFAVGRAQGLANYALAVPGYLARGFNPLPEMSDRAFVGMIDAALAAPAWVSPKKKPNPAQRIVELSAWRARRLLKRARRDPAALPKGRLAEAPILRRAGLLWHSLRL
ncbi:MAG: squalene/phytoene synthase family protein [Pseudomonadota bacterium]